VCIEEVVVEELHSFAELAVRASLSIQFTYSNNDAAVQHPFPTHAFRPQVPMASDVP
jgi:hypothetical protein